MMLPMNTCNIWCVLLVRTGMKEEFTLCDAAWLGHAYRMIWVAAALAGYLSAWAQPDLSRSLPPLPDGYWLQLEETAQHSAGELSGMTTYRVYLNCLHPNDYLSSCSGDNSNPMSIQVAEGWYNSPFNAGWNASGINPLIFNLSLIHI